MTEIRYGRKLEDPYEVSNIKKALESLKASGVKIPAVPVEPNHAYLRFEPANPLHLSLLENDTTLVLFDHPLNYEFSGEEDDAFNSSDSSPSFYYSVVPYGKPLPAVPYEIIYDVFIPEPEEYTTKSSSGGTESFYDQLIYESARLTGNLPLEDSTGMQLKGSLQTKWNPNGRITAWDDVLDQFIPLKNVNVHARWFTHVETALTDDEGFFRMGSFRSKVNYSIKWENTMFSIRNGSILQAWYNGPRKKGDWNLDIRNGRSLMYATIHRAALKHFYGDNLGLSRPVLKSGARTRIFYDDNEGTGEFSWSKIGLTPNIRIWGKTKGAYRTTNELFGSVVHELGHQSHYQHVGHSKYGKTSKLIRESWAEAVEWAMVNDEYHKLGNKYNNKKAAAFNHHYNIYISWPDVDEKDYSPVFIDLADNINQRLVRGPKYPNDMITGYSLEFINSKLLINSTDIGTLRDELKKNTIEGVDEYMINELLLLY